MNYVKERELWDFCNHDNAITIIYCLLDGADEVCKYCLLDGADEVCKYCFDANCLLYELFTFYLKFLNVI